MFTNVASRLWLVVSVAGGVAATGCQSAAQDGESTSPTVVRAAVFVNGDMESSAIGASPAGWTVSARQNRGITDTRPAAQTLASLNLLTGGYLATQVVGGATESQADPNLGTSASFRYPKYGTRSAVVNYLNATSRGNSYNANVMSQTMTTTNSDVDSSDNKIHVRFAIAPVLESGGHPYNEQPYYYVALENLTKGTTLYSDFNASAQAGVPWKIVGSMYYTDWQLVDIAPGNAGLAVGDQVKLTVVAAGCSQSGHFGRVYVDGIGSTIPGLYTWATGPSSANQGSDITYVVNYRNGGTGTASGTTLSFVVPAGTTYKANGLPSACTTPAVGATGTVNCALGTLAPGSSGTFTITVNVNNSTSGTTITNGNYSIQATGVTALLGPKVRTVVTSNVTYADVAITNTDGVAAVGWGQVVNYTMTVSNAGPGAASSVTVADAFPGQLTGTTWTCVGSGGGTCTASGTGNINTTASLPVGASVTYSVSASVVAGSGTGTVVNTATATVGGGTIDPDTTNNSAVDSDSIGVLRTLTLNKVNGNGGSVISVPASISCGTSCASASGTFVDGTSVVLTAAPVSGATFTSWGGACASAGSTPTCTLTVSADVMVSAAFTPPPSVNITSGNNQGAAIGTSFGAPLAVQVLDSNGSPISGATVVFSLPSSGASAALSSMSVTTNGAGVATVTATANGTAGAYGIVAGLSGTPTTATFNLWNYGAAATLSIVSGSGQSATVTTGFPMPLIAMVVDAASQPVSGASVTFAGPGSGASATINSSPATTNSMGLVTVNATASSLAGSYAVTARASGVVSTVSFALINVAGSPSQMTVTGGGSQSAVVGAAFGAPLQVTVQDAFGSPVPGTTVMFAAPGSAATAMLSAVIATTDASGQASVTATASTASGGYTVTASVSGVTVGCSFSLTNLPGAATSIATVSGGGQSTVAGRAFAAPLVAVVVDAYGNMAVGAAVSFAAPSSGASAVIATAAVVSSTSGLISTSATANGIEGTYVVTATVAGVSTPASFTLTNTAALAITPASVTAPPNGAVAFVASGGSGTGYVFTIASNQSGATIAPSTGTYRAGGTSNVSDVVTVTDSLGGTATAMITVGVGVSLTPPTSIVPPRGQVAFIATGGAGSGYTFSITSNLSGGTIDAAGGYEAGTGGETDDVITVSDALGNTATATIHVGAILGVLGSSSSSPPRGTLTFSTTGGSGTGIVYALSTSASGGSVNASTGAYAAGSTPLVTDIVTATDSLGNVASATVQVGAGITLTPTTPAVAPSTPIHFVASGGSGQGYLFAFVTNASGATINATSGNYVAGSSGNAVDVIRATDSLGNFASVSVAVGAGLSISPASPTATPGQTLGFTAQGGSGTGYLYTLTANASGGQVGLSTGVYRAGLVPNVSDTVVVTDSLGNQGSTTVQVGAGVIITPAALTLAPGGTSTFSVSGGSGAGYTFSLSTDASGGSIDAGTGAYLSGSTGGVVDVIRVVDSLGVSATASVTVTPSLAASLGAYSAPPGGSLTLHITGGAGGNTFSLVANGSGGTINALTGAYVAGRVANTSDLVLVTDGNGKTISVSILVGAGLSVDPAVTAVAPLGSVTLVASGGSGLDYRFRLTSNSSGSTVGSGTGEYTAGTVPDGVDVITVFDSLGNIATAYITVGTGLRVDPSAPQVPPRGMLSFVVMGGSGTGYNFELISNQSEGSFDSSTGAYRAGDKALVTDQLKVTDSLGNAVIVSISVGEALTIAPTVAALAPRGVLQFSARGGSGNGVTFSMATDASGATIDANTGSYQAGPTPHVTDTVKVTDDLGNQATAVISVEDGVTIDPPVVTVSPGGTVRFDASGGGGGYTFAVRANGSGGTIVSTTGIYTAGSRPNTEDTIEVVDGFGNLASASVTVGAGITVVPASLRLVPRATARLVASGGSGTGYTFALTMNGSNGSIDAQTGLYTAGATTDTSDTILVTDSFGNTATVNVAVGRSLAINPAAPAVAPGESVDFVASGGSGTGYAFTFLSNPSGGTIDEVSGRYRAGEGGSVTDVVVVSDSEGHTALVHVAVGQRLTITPATSMIGPAGKLRFTVVGGSGLGNLFAVSSNESGATVDSESGNYQAGIKGLVTDVVTVTDSLNSTDSATVVVKDALQVTPSSATLPPQGTLQAVATGGTRDYAFTMSSADSGGMVDRDSGRYRAGKTGDVTDVISVQDANGVSAQVTITVGPGITINPRLPAVSSGGTVSLTAQGGSGTGYIWRMSKDRSGGTVDGDGRFTAGPASAGDVTDLVEVTDDLGNTASVSIAIRAARVVTIGGGSGCSVSGGPDSGDLPNRVALALALALCVIGLSSRRRTSASE